MLLKAIWAFFLWKYTYFRIVFSGVPLPVFLIGFPDDFVFCWIFLPNACWACFSVKLPVLGLSFKFTCLFLQNNLASLQLMVVVGLFVPYGLILGYNYLYLRLQRMWFNRVCEKISIHSVKSMANKYKAKRPRLYTSSDQSYFDSYGDVAVHEEMLGDIVRTNAYRQAIFNCSPSLQNKVRLSCTMNYDMLCCTVSVTGTGSTV